MAKTVKVGRGAACIRCHRPIGTGRKAIMERTGLGFYYYHPSCHDPTRTWYHGRYVKKSSLTKKKRRK